MMCAQGLSSMIHGGMVEGQFEGIQVGTRGLKISHLFFTDDSLFFFKANIVG